MGIHQMSQNKRAEEAFEHWYSSVRSCRKTSEHVGVCERQVERWAVKYGWRERADERDREAIRLARERAIAEQVERLRAHARWGQLLVGRSVEYFRDHKIENASDAIRAGKEGIAAERQAYELPDYLIRVQQMSEDELRADLDRLRRLTDGMAGAAAMGDPGEGTDDLLANGASKVT
jgi:hypothetical protein